MPVGAGGSRLLRGNHREHEALEAEAAAFFGAESALFFGGGFMRQRGAVLDAAAARRPRRARRADPRQRPRRHARWARPSAPKPRTTTRSAFEDAIKDWRAAGGTGTPWIAVESLYSMDGDRAPLDDLMAIADRHDGVLVIDEAHATGVFGPDGRGLGAAPRRPRQRHRAAHLRQGARRHGRAGRWARRCSRDFLVNRCRPFIYATAPSPLMAALVRAALDHLPLRDRAARAAAALVAFAGRQLASRCGIAPSGSQIQPVIVGADERAMQLAAAMQARGFDIRAIRPPTVPEGTARLRLSLTLNVDEATIAAMAGGARRGAAKEARRMTRAHRRHRHRYRRRQDRLCRGARRRARRLSTGSRAGGARGRDGRRDRAAAVAACRPSASCPRPIG